MSGSTEVVAHKYEVAAGEGRRPGKGESRPWYLTDDNVDVLLKRLKLELMKPRKRIVWSEG
jgi:hypothetical protein